MSGIQFQTFTPLREKEHRLWFVLEGAADKHA